MRNLEKEVEERSWTGRDVQPVFLVNPKTATFLDAVDLMSRNSRDERFWYNCKQAVDCSQGDMQVISRKVEGKLLEI